MTSRLTFLAAWASLVVVISGIVHWLSGINFWIACAIVAAALIVNGLLADWEDRRPGGFYNPKEEREL